MFDDTRPAWAAGVIPGGFEGKDVLELGPFEGYQTYGIARAGARRILAVEANSINFLKCLCVKELYGLDRAHFLLGDIAAYVGTCPERFDVVWASGVLYHLQNPMHFIECVAGLAPYAYVWTHYFDASAMAALDDVQARHFVPNADVVRRYGERDVVLHARSYLIPDYADNVPAYWEGGLDELTYWLEKDDIVWLFERAGMTIERIEFDDTSINGLPAFAFVARRS
jgi:SAM-dependent methyltransferase